MKMAGVSIQKVNSLMSGDMKRNRIPSTVAVNKAALRKKMNALMYASRFG